MNLDTLIIEERKRRERTAWQPEPLHAPTPWDRVPSPQRPADDEEQRGGTVIIIDMGDYTETRDQG